MFNISFVVVTVKARLVGLRPPPRGGRDGPRRERADDVLEGHVPADPAGHHGRGAAGVRLSIDDFVITNFVSGTTNTFPIWVYGDPANALPVQINVIGSIVFLGAVGLVGLTLVIAVAAGAARIR